MLVTARIEWNRIFSSISSSQESSELVSGQSVVVSWLGIVAFITESMENQFSRRHIWSLDLRRYYFIILVIFYNKAKEYILYYYYSSI